MIKIRNLYLAHQFTESFNAKAGLISTVADARSFIFNDHISSIQANYQGPFYTGLIWYGNIARNRPTSAAQRDEYWGFNGSLGFLSKVKHSIYGVVRNVNSESFARDNAGTYTAVSGDTSYYWLGATVGMDQMGPFSVEGTAIGNWSTFTPSTGSADRDSGYLADLKASYAASSLVSFSLEGLTTSGEKSMTTTIGSTEYKILGKRKNFVSPVDTAYLLTIATSDGADDAPGSKRPGSVIAPLSINEGLTAAVVTANFTFNKRTSAFLRYGHLVAKNDSSNNGKELGSEVDTAFIYQLSPSSILQLDYARFMPGSYYAHTKSSADLGALKVKMVF